MTVVDGRWCRIYYAGERRGTRERDQFVVTYHRAVGKPREVTVEHPPGCKMPPASHVARARQLTISPRLLTRMLKGGAARAVNG